MAKNKQPKKQDASSTIYARVNGISLYGKFCSVLFTDTAMELHTKPTWLFILCAWLGVMAMMSVGIFIGNFWVLTVLSIAGGVCGALLVWFLYTGKCVQSFSYQEIASFVMDRADCLINLKNNQMHTIRMMPKRQKLLISTLSEVLDQHTPHKLVKQGEYFRIEEKAVEKTN